jgi:hypothetical protein
MAPSVRPAGRYKRFLNKKYLYRLSLTNDEVCAFGLTNIVIVFSLDGQLARTSSAPNKSMLNMLRSKINGREPCYAILCA